nr:MAG TPA: hypothetical protein [Caudoviricetes sp.]
MFACCSVCLYLVVKHLYNHDFLLLVNSHAAAFVSCFME